MGGTVKDSHPLGERSTLVSSVAFITVRGSPPPFFGMKIGRSDPGPGRIAIGGQFRSDKGPGSPWSWPQAGPN